MSIMRYSECAVVCDRCGAAQEYEGYDTAVEARRWAKRRGWASIAVAAVLGHQDLCPDCERLRRARLRAGADTETTP